MKQIYLVCFDIENDRIRRKVGNALLVYGQRVQYSVFEICVTRPSQLESLKAELKNLLAETEHEKDKDKESDKQKAETSGDDLRFYQLNNVTLANSCTIDEEPVGVFPSATIL